MISLYEVKDGSYTSVGDFNIPNLFLTETNYEIGFWGYRHKKHLKENHRIIYYNLLTSGKLNSYLHKIDVRASKQYDLLVKQLAERQGVTEQLKADNQILWVQKINNIANQAREIVNNEIIYK